MGLNTITASGKDGTSFHDFVIDPNSTYEFNMEIVARSPDGSSAHFIRQGLVTADSAGFITPVGPLAIIGIDNNIPGWFPDISVDELYRELSIKIIGVPTPAWIAIVNFLQIKVGSP